VVEHVVAPRDIILNGIMTHAHISGSNPTPMSFKFKIPKGLDPMVESEEFFTIGQGSILMRDLPGAMGTP
jgi:hypothetical protein